jgi:hypothetical protein
MFLYVMQMSVNDNGAGWTKGVKGDRRGSGGADGGGVQLAVRKDAADPRVFHFPSRETLVNPIFPVSQVA